MAEKNWSLAENGAQIAEVSHEATHVASSAANLLISREDFLWITGDAPQHVTFRLNPSHPPLLYAGWHVWHDYLTNPKTVEIASGSSAELMVGIVVCQALPGAGTQVWKLPQPIPSEHTYVRFKVLETFGPGPTYMNNAVLLANDPGPRYRTESATTSPAVATASLPMNPMSSTPSVTASAGSPPLFRKEPYTSLNPSIRPGRASVATTGASRAVPFAASVTAPFAASTFDSAYLQPQQQQQQQQHAPQEGFVSPNTYRSANNGRMSKLLRELDEDIRLLKPIKSVSPSKNMLVYVPQDAPFLPSYRDEEEEEDADTDDSSQSNKGERRRSRRRHGSSRHRSKGHRSSSSSPQQMRIEYIPPPPPQQVSQAFQERLAMLEQAVASLTQTVQHQREDLTMIKRLLLQQATERRREAERRLQREMAAPPPAAPPLVPSSTALAAAGGRVADGAHRLLHREISVDFPEDALRAFVESIMTEKLHKLAKRSEAKTLTRLDAYLQDVVRGISDTVDDRVREQIANCSQTPELPSRVPATGSTCDMPSVSGAGAGTAGAVASSLRTPPRGYGLRSSHHHNPHINVSNASMSATGASRPGTMLHSQNLWSQQQQQSPGSFQYSPAQSPHRYSVPISIVKDSLH